MALVMVTWDLPTGERLAVYEEQVQTTWLPRVLRQSGMKEVRAYRNPHHTTPQVMVHLEFDSMKSQKAYIASESCPFLHDLFFTGTF